MYLEYVFVWDWPPAKLMVPQDAAWVSHGNWTRRAAVRLALALFVTVTAYAMRSVAVAVTGALPMRIWLHQWLAETVGAIKASSVARNTHAVRTRLRVRLREGGAAATRPLPLVSGMEFVPLSRPQQGALKSFNVRPRKYLSSRLVDWSEDWEGCPGWVFIALPRRY
jgi:hypothetical protein